MKKRHRNVQIYFIVSFAAILCYINSLSGDFVHDDLPAIVFNRDVSSNSPIVDILFNDFWGMPMRLKESHKSYRPLTTLSFRLNRLLFDLNAFWFHIVNVILHGVSSVLFTRICSKVAGFTPNWALIAGVLFAVHPIHTESVSGIVGRAELLGCSFFSLSFLSYHGNKTKDPDDRSLCISILFGGLAMLAKESGVTVFIVNLVYDFYRNWPSLKKSIQDVRWSQDSQLFSKRFSRRMMSVLVSMMVFLVTRIALLQGSLPRFSQQDNPAAFHSSFQARVLTFFYLSSFNLWLLLCPSQLSHDWQMGSIPLVLSLRDTRNIVTVFTIIAILCLVYKIYNDLELQKHVPAIVGFILMVFPFILPASNLLVTVGFVLAERILFIPSMGFCILVLYGVQLLYERMTKARRILKVSGFLLISFFCLKTVTRNQDWLSRESLLKSGLRVLPHNAKMHYNYANFLRDTSNFNLAKHHYRKALRLWPNYPSAWNNLGTIIDDDTDLQEQHFLAAIEFSDQHLNAHFNLGQLYRKSNRSSEQARKMFEKCIEISGSFAPAYLGLSKIQSGILSGISLLKALKLNEDSPIVRLEFADWLQTNNLYIEALRHYTLGIPHKSSLQGSFVTGALKTLRSLGQKERMLQLMLRWHVIKRENLDKTVTQLYLKDWSMKNEISKKARLYEHTIMHRINDCTSNIENRSTRNTENRKFFSPTPLNDDNADALLKPNRNRSGIYSVSSKGTNFCDIIIPSSAAAGVADDPSILLKMKKKIRRNKILKFRKNKDIFNTNEERIEPMISIDKL